MKPRRWWLTALALGVLAPGVAGADPDPKAAKVDAKAAKVDPKAAKTPAAKPATPSTQPVAAAETTPANDAQPAAPEMVKQDLSGHDLGPSKRANVFERDRFFVDKTDSEKTEKGTLIQGSLTSSTFGYHESGGNLTPPPQPTPPVVFADVPDASRYDRLFTDLRLQTDFRHISAGRWDARIDVRGRLVGGADAQTAIIKPNTDTAVQSGLFGKNELEIKELWLVRKGVRSDVYIGRQFIPDLGALRIDGLRVDYASSEKLTWLGFAGLYPIRGSRSITDDYAQLYAEPNSVGQRGTAGRFTGTGGFGAAYRTLNTYGSVGGVVVAPFAGETPRVYATSTGYWRLGPKLDFYHFLILDAVGSNAVNTGLTNLSLGLNWKPDQRLRGTLTFDRVDTETLNVQAQAFLQNPDVNFNFFVQNEAFVQRIATNQGRASLSAGLGQLQRFELTAAMSYRYRGDVSLSTTAAMGMMPTIYLLPSAQSLEVYGSVTDRRSVANLRIGLDASKVFGVGDSSFQHTTSTTARLFLSHEIGNGRGEWELEGAYSHNEDDGAGIACDATKLQTCFGKAKSNVLSGGGNLFIRISRNWFTMASLFVNHTAIARSDNTLSVVDPAIVGLSGFFRLAYRF